MAYIDFAELKERISIEDAIDILDLDMGKRGNQYRGPCPVCKEGGERALVITPEKQAFYCFPAKSGGDVIALAAHIRDERMKDAAAFLDGHSPSRHVPEERTKQREAEHSLQPLSYLHTDHDTLDELGLSPETCEHFECGYAPKGIMRGRLAIPIHDFSGELIAYCGRAVKDDQTPMLIFPKGFDPSRHVFNLNRMDGGELMLVTDPLDVLIAYENGVENVVSLLHRFAEDNVVPLKRRA